MGIEAKGAGYDKSLSKGEREMFTRIGEVMLYVNDQEAVRKFWTEKLGFIVASESEKGVKVGEIETFSSERTFNFAGNEENYFAVMENGG